MQPPFTIITTDSIRIIMTISPSTDIPTAGILARISDLTFTGAGDLPILHMAIMPTLDIIHITGLTGGITDPTMDTTKTSMCRSTAERQRITAPERGHFHPAPEVTIC